MDNESRPELGSKGSAWDSEEMTELWSARCPPYELPDDHQFEYWKELNEQTDRGVAVLAASFLEWRIRQSIKTRFDIWDEHAERIFGNDKKGGELSFWDQCEVAYGLAIIGPIALNDLNRIGRIRNKFAHHASIRSFDHDAVRDLVDELKTHEIMAEKIRLATRDVPSLGKVHEIPTRRKRYAFTVHHIADAIWLAGRHYSKPGPKPNHPYTYW